VGNPIDISIIGSNIINSIVDISKQNTDFTLLAGPSHFTAPDGSAYTVIVYRYSDPSLGIITVKDVFIVNGNILTQIKFFDNPNSFNSLVPIFDDMVTTYGFDSSSVHPIRTDIINQTLCGSDPHISCYVSSH